MTCTSKVSSWALDPCGDVGDEKVAASGNIDNESIPVSSVAQRAAQCGNMDSEIGWLDKDIGPNASQQFLLSDQLAGTFQQSNEDFQSTASQLHWLIALQQ